jgi:hypothetical protein
MLTEVTRQQFNLGSCSRPLPILFTLLCNWLLVLSGSAWAVGEIPSTHPLCGFAKELARRYAETHAFERTSPTLEHERILREHTAALILLSSDRLCHDAEFRRVAAEYVSSFCGNTIRETSGSHEAAVPPWGVSARRLRLLAAASRLPKGIAQKCIPCGEEALDDLLRWVHDDGLLWCDVKRTKKGLGPNLEAYVALRLAATFFRNMNRRDLARRALLQADRLHEAIENRFWVTKLGRYAWEIDSSGTLRTRAQEWTPDMSSQLTAIRTLPPNSALRALFDDLVGAIENRSWNLTSPVEVKVLASYAAAARQAGAGRIYRMLLEPLGRIPPSAWDAIDLDTWLTIASALAPDQP